MEPKVCTKCGIGKNVDEFYHHNGKPVQPCKACKKAHIQNTNYEEDPNHPMVIVKRRPGRPRTTQTNDKPHHNPIKKEPIGNQNLEFSYPNKETQNKVVIMEMSVFIKAIRLAFEKGKMNGKSFDDLMIKEVNLEQMLEQIFVEK